jgi:two-component system sensor histidine kinase QseC
MISKKNSLNLKLELTNNSTSNANMQYLQEGIDRMSHIVEQILLLNRTNPEQYQGQVSSNKYMQLHFAKMLSPVYFQKLKQKTRNRSHRSRSKHSR